MPFAPATTAAVEESLRWAVGTPFWLDDPHRPAALPPLTAAARADLVVVGGGLTGLWTALRAKERDPDRDVLLLEAARTGWAASGRSGGFVEASLTHGRANGRRHLPHELERLEELGLRNLDGIEASVARHGWRCGFERTGLLSVATEPHQVAWLRGREGFLDREAVREQVRSPTYLAGAWDRRGAALVDPARLVHELRRTCLELGVRIAEGTPVRALEGEAGGVLVRCERAAVRARHVALATSAFPSLLRRYRLHTVPVHDYALVTEPLPPALWEQVGWRGRQGVEDLANRFHYYRRTADGRVLFGGYDAVHRFGGRLSAAHDQRPATFRRLAAHFAQTFPQFEGARFTHAWGGAIDTCTRFFPFFGTGHGGRAVHVAGFTGLGLGAGRFAADVLLDLLALPEHGPTELTELDLVRRVPPPFPPEPLAWAGIALTTRALARADARQGRRGPWLRALDRLGVGFAS
ncbi:NAD(P)/FAD-dependent oxidoreductase [Kineococcus gypseus]|uniref:NAD(P)/FAD-dependent oxidoreductase n=1 Tax=Kineococcus gypseus TaxID=1637102 RepID=UPI003D7EA749